MRHFLTLLDITADEARALLARAAELKRMQKLGVMHHTLEGKTLGMIFDKASTRTRVSFEVGMFQLGGHALFLHSGTTQLGRGEPIEDSARVLSRMVDMIMIRTFGHDTLQRFAEYSSVPVINALTDWTHPCQILADVFTYTEQRGDIAGRTVAWIGDGNNMAHSWVNGAVSFGYRLHLACPAGYMPDERLLAAARTLGADIRLTDKPLEAAAGADLVTTDVWASMGQEDEQAEREKAFAGFTVDARLMAEARPDALFMHCLPAHRGEEVTADVIDGPQSVVWDEAENRLHVQKALMEFLLTH
ncbi:MAG TPA: ornithine carbamoyltransferase [Mariprofundaceae bacterium]|nr:ornithine carbamoyltransferase [Mariprofundaceae bacterium]